MAENKTKPTTQSIDVFLDTVSEQRAAEAREIITEMKAITGLEPVLWGPSIIGFGSMHYKYDTGREGDMPLLGFSPRKATLTIYFSEGFDRYADDLEKLGKHKISVSCLYLNKLSDANRDVLSDMLKKSYAYWQSKEESLSDVDAYIASIPQASLEKFTELRNIVKSVVPNAKEVMSYGILGYKIDEKRARVFVSGWKDHVAMYPIPKDEALRKQLEPYSKGKGTLWFPLTKPLPKALIKATTAKLVEP